MFGPTSFFEKVHHMPIKNTGWFSGTFAGMAIVAAVSGWVADLFIKRGYDPINAKAFTYCRFRLRFRSNAEPLHGLRFGGDLPDHLSPSGLGLATANYWR
jgi:hypothetical protein